MNDYDLQIQHNEAVKLACEHIAIERTRTDRFSRSRWASNFGPSTIVAWLKMDVPLVRAKIPDWRSMVDCIMVDPAHDGEIFNVALSDVPERKDDLVAGSYELAAPEAEATVAVKIIDMLGEVVVADREQQVSCQAFTILLQQGW